MKNTIGNALTLTLFGESHGPAIGAVIDGISPGIKIDEEYIKARLDQRKPYGESSTKRREPDVAEIISGMLTDILRALPLR